MSFKFTCLDVTVHGNEPFNAYVEKFKNGRARRGYEMKMLFRMRKAIHRNGTCLFLLYQQNLSICSIPLQIGALHFPCGSFSPFLVE